MGRGNVGGEGQPHSLASGLPSLSHRGIPGGSRLDREKPQACPEEALTVPSDPCAPFSVARL